VYSEVERIGVKAGIVHFQPQVWHLHGQTKENSEKLKSVYLSNKSSVTLLHGRLNLLPKTNKMLR